MGGITCRNDQISIHPTVDSGDGQSSDTPSLPAVKPLKTPCPRQQSTPCKVLEDGAGITINKTAIAEG